jgi:hypothetical protein
MKTRIRPQKIVIEMPSESEEVWVMIQLQQIIYEDDKTTITQITPRINYVHRALSHFIGDIFRFEDPEVDPGVIKDISGQGIFEAIRSALYQWMIREYSEQGAYVEGDRIWLS